MKKVTGCIDVGALGHYDWCFYVEDDTTDEEIKKKVEEVCDYYIDYFNIRPQTYKFKNIEFSLRIINL